MSTSQRPDTLSDNELADLRQRGDGRLPGMIGVEIVDARRSRLHSRLSIRPELLAPNGFLHAATVITLADTTCGYGCFINLPDGAAGFTTIELKSNHLSTAREGGIACIATPVHLGGTTHVWDATVTSEESDRTIALFRCTQMILRKQN